jgi:hypothetical protein
MRRECAKKSSLRKFPYPFKAGIAISNDNHANFPPQHFIDAHRLLNSDDDTPYGPGLGLEIANSFWFYSANPNRGFTYFNGLGTEPSRFAPLFRKYLRAGLIDTLHTYGDFSQPNVFCREFAIRALDEIRAQNLNVPVWVNHGNKHNIQNVNKGVPYHQGAVAESVAYHSDLTAQAGVKFYWTSRLTKVVGQERTLTLRERVNFDSGSPLLTVARLARAYATRGCATNALLQLFEVDDGRKLYVFPRFNNHDNIWAGIFSEGLRRQLDRSVLDELVARRGYMIVYNHLLDHFPFGDDDIKALRNLSEEFKTGRILVATTSRLLWYFLMNRSVQWDEECENEGSIRIRIRPVLVDDVLGKIELREKDLTGLTFYVAGNQRVEIYLGTNRIQNVAKNQPDETGRTSVSLPWQPLRFTEDLHHCC